MPFLDDDGRRAYYRHWAAENPTAAVVFLHGFGEHTGVYHRYAFALNARGIDVWAVDQRLARELDRAWDRFGSLLPTLTVPTLAVHGTDDPIADVGAVRAYAETIEALTLLEIDGGRHDVLNDVEHRRVVAAVADFVDAHCR